MFTDTLETEYYLEQVTDRTCVRDAARSRYGVAPLDIERVRYSQTCSDPPWEKQTWVAYRGGHLMEGSMKTITKATRAIHLWWFTYNKIVIIRDETCYFTVSNISTTQSA